MENYQKIITNLKLPDTFSEYLVLCLDNNDIAIYACKLGEESAVKITITEVIAFHVYEELSHINMDSSKDSPKPPFSNESKTIYYPLLEVVNSHWIKSFSENRLRDYQRANLRHFQCLSYSNIVDVLAYNAPKLAIIPFAEYNAIKELITGKFT